MKKNSKKIVVSLAATMFIASSVGHADNFSYNKTKRYNSYNSGYDRKAYIFDFGDYSNNYLQNMFENKVVIRYTPKYWESDSDINKLQEPWTPVEYNKENDEVNKEENNNTTSNTNANISIEDEVVRLVNIERQKEGLAPLANSSELSKVARTKSQDMANNNYFSHNSPTYGDPFAMMKSFGIQYRTAGENIAKGYSSAESVVKGWMNSSGHRANILNPSFGKIGVGYVNVNGTTYWTQMFTD